MAKQGWGIACSRLAAGRSHRKQQQWTTGAAGQMGGGDAKSDEDTSGDSGETSSHDCLDLAVGHDGKVRADHER